MTLRAKQVSMIVTSATLYAIFFFLSGLIAVPKFTILYLPIILLGVFPLWFGLSGLAGSMIGAFIGGFFVEGLGFLAWIESITTLIIYGLNWVLIPKNIKKALPSFRRLRSDPLLGHKLHTLAIHSVGIVSSWLG